MRQLGFQFESNLVGDGVEEGAEGRHDALPSRDVAVKPVRERGTRKDRSAPHVAPGQGRVK